MLCLCVCFISLVLASVSPARAEPVASQDLGDWIAQCASVDSSFKWTDLGYPWLRIDWGYKSVDTKRLDALPTMCSTPHGQALRLLRDAVVLSERELARGQGPVLALFYQYWGCSEAAASQLTAAARSALPQALGARPDPERDPEGWLIWKWALLTESSPWQC